jgi:hypothetical protein
MPHRDPSSYELLTYLWVLFVSLWAGIAHNLKRIAENKETKISPLSLLIDVVISGFVGLITFFLCEAAKMPPMLSAAIIGISAHMGSRALFLLEKTMVKLFKVRTGTDK